MPVSANILNADHAFADFSRLRFFIVYGQIVNATLQGAVQDAIGATVAEAKVEALNTATGIVTRTESNANGRFVFAALAPRGPYTIIMEAKGFKAEDRTGIHLQIHQATEMHYRNNSRPLPLITVPVLTEPPEEYEYPQGITNPRRGSEEIDRAAAWRIRRELAEPRDRASRPSGFCASINRNRLLFASSSFLEKMGVKVSTLSFS